MNLLEENGKPQKTGKQKIVLGLLIISIIALILIVALIVFIIIGKPQTQNAIKFKINNKEVKTSQNFILTTSNGEIYLELKELSNLLNYTYYNGAYLEFSENKEECYIDNGYEIIGMKKDSKNIYKTAVDNTLGYQYIDISREIVYYNDKLYINVIDLPVALNLMIENGSINTTEQIATSYETAVVEKGYESVDMSPNNLKAIAYNLLVVNKDSKKGIVNRNLEEIVGTKYTTIDFVELSKDFIVSGNNKYGILNTNGDLKARIIYDDIKVLSYSPLLYIVKRDNKFGILNKEGAIVVNTLYDTIGYTERNRTGAEDTVIIPQLVDGIGKTVVVSINNKYGLIEIDSKNVVIECTSDGIYGLKNAETINYYIKIGENEYNLIDYIKQIKTRT